MRRTRLVAVALVAAGALVAPASSATTATRTVDVANTFYSPEPVHANLNDTVHWVWQNGTHSTTSGTCGATCTPNGTWDSGTSSTVGHTFDYLANAVGTFTYFCSVHTTAMQGTLIVNNPTSVTFTGLVARRTRGRVAVTWRTASELDVLGYSVYRQTGSRRVAASDLIVVKGLSRPAAYRFVDRGARVSPGLRYLLQVVHANGSRSWFGTVAVS